MALTGDPLPAELAAEWGLIWKVVDDSQLSHEADRLVEKFAAAPTAGLAATKHLIRNTWGNDLASELELQRDTMSRLGRTTDYQEGVAAFFAKRPPVFTGR